MASYDLLMDVTFPVGDPSSDIIPSGNMAAYAGGSLSTAGPVLSPEPYLLVRPPGPQGVLLAAGRGDGTPGTPGNQATYQGIDITLTWTPSGTPPAYTIFRVSARVAFAPGGTTLATTLFAGSPLTGATAGIDANTATALPSGPWPYGPLAPSGNLFPRYLTATATPGGGGPSRTFGVRLASPAALTAGSWPGRFLLYGLRLEGSTG